MKNRKLEKLLYKSFDAVLTTQEAEKLNTGLRELPELRNTYEQIRRLRGNLNGITSPDIKPFFEERLLNKISLNNNSIIVSWADTLMSPFRQIAFTAMVILMFLVVYNINAGNYSGISDILGSDETPIEYALDPTIQFFME